MLFVAVYLFLKLMWMICKKEWQQFFSNLTGYLSIAVFLLVLALILFVFPNTNVLDFGYATLGSFFETAPFVLLFLVPTITMRLLADEFKNNTFEILKTLPITNMQIVLGKFLGALAIVASALLPTIVYGFSIQQLSSTGGIDVGATIGSYIGLFFLAACFVSIGIYASSFTNNTVVAFVAAAFVSFLIYYGFTALSALPIFTAGLDYFIQQLGLHAHYTSISRGVIDTRDIVYFIGFMALFIVLTQKNIENK
jgi:ABC-2 type transport system permease protein